MADGISTLMGLDVDVLILGGGGIIAYGILCFITGSVRRWTKRNKDKLDRRHNMMSLKEIYKEELDKANAKANAKRRAEYKIILKDHMLIEKEIKKEIKEED